jgi:3,4-dihydroxy-2-butanone 4-phosphate synthase
MATIPAVITVTGPVGPAHWILEPLINAVRIGMSPELRIPIKAPRPDITPNAAPRLRMTKLAEKAANRSDKKKFCEAEFFLVVAVSIDFMMFFFIKSKYFCKNSNFIYSKNKYRAHMQYSDLDIVLKKFAQGDMIIVVCEDREQEGDFFVLGEAITPQKINFMLTYGKGMICTSCAPAILDRLQIPLMVDKPGDIYGTNFTVSVDAADGISTGVSANDRAATIRVLAKSDSVPSDLVLPGHSQPLRSRDPLSRWGHTECSVELARLVGKIPVVAICEILNVEGEKASGAELFALAKKFDLPITNLKLMREVLV